MSEPRTTPTQVEIADLVMLLSYYEGREGSDLTSEDRDGEAYLHAQNAADAILALLADQPTVTEARAQALTDAADAIQHHGTATTNASAARTWLRDLAARERGERP